MTRVKQSLSQSTGSRPLTGYHVAAMIVAFFAVIIAVNLTMAWFASNSWSGLVVKNSYVASQQYNEKIAAANLQKAKGWQLKFSYADNRLSFWLSDGIDQPVLIENIAARIGRPASEIADKELILSHLGKGHYRADIVLAKGIWSFQLDGGGNQPYHSEGRFIVSQEGVGTLE